MPAFLRVPGGEGPFPCAVLIGGLDAAKEDAHQFSSLCVERGPATLAFDGPGQGETYYRGTLFGPGYHRAVSAVIDVLGQEPAIDGQRIGVVGRSTGGFPAPVAAVEDGRIRACVAWGAMYDLAEFDAIPPLVKQGYQFVTASPNLQAAKEAMRFVNLRGIAERISCPLYVVHGGKDNIAPPSNATRLVAEAQGPTVLRLFEKRAFTAITTWPSIIRPEMADWLAAQLGATPSQG